jgi:hypothetical protein
MCDMDELELAEYLAQLEAARARARAALETRPTVTLGTVSATRLPPEVPAES